LTLVNEIRYGGSVSNILYTSDLHLGHEHVAETRGFKNHFDHDEWIVDLWNDAVGKNDIIFVLGDIAVDKTPYALAILRGLPGRKRLVAGNHDQAHPLNHRRFAAWLPKYLDVFETVSPMMMRKVGDRRVMLSHFPYESWGDGEAREGSRFEEWRLPDKGLPLLHGHTHGTEREHGRMLHVGVDAWGRPVKESEVAAWLATVPTEPPTTSQDLAARRLALRLARSI